MKLNFTLFLAILIIFALVVSGCKTQQFQPDTTGTVVSLTATTKTMSNTLSPARDLTGTWIDIPGEGLVYTILGDPNKFHDDIRMEIVQKGNAFTGTMWVSIWKVDVLNPDNPYPFALPTETIAVPVTDGIVQTSDVQFTAMTWRWVGTFTNDIMKGTITGYDASSGVHYTGDFNLRKK